jgi:hypothetical protein
VSAIGPALERLCAEVVAATARQGQIVQPQTMGVLDRQGVLDLAAPGRISPNRACRLIRCADDWLALNLARDEDRELVPAWLCDDPEADAWAQIERLARTRPAAELLEAGILLGLPIARVGEMAADGFAPPLLPMAAPQGSRRGPLKVVDLSALWAGPLCGAILAAMGAEATKIESAGRPDPTRASTPEFFRRLNGGKAHLALDLRDTDQRLKLREAAIGADILITSARPRAFAGLGIEPQDIFAANPGLVWVAITGYGWTGAAAGRVAFGDDAAAAGGLVGWTSGEPRFLGDALSDPLTGLVAASGALTALDAGGAVVVDVAMARCAAGAARFLGLGAAA